MKNAIVIIPTYKERENIRAMIDTVFGLPKDFHILIVDDNSPDGTPEIVEQMQQEYNTDEVKLHMVRRKGKLGLGTALNIGFDLHMYLGKLPGPTRLFLMAIAGRCPFANCLAIGDAGCLEFNREFIDVFQ